MENKKRIAICHIVFQLDFGGLENGLINLINNLPAERYKHTIICLTHATKFKERIKQSDVDIYELHKKEGKGLGIYGKVWQLLRQIKPEIVHTRNLPTIDMTVPAYLAGLRDLVHSEHGLDYRELQGNHKKYNRIRWASQILVKVYIALSRDLFTWMSQSAGISERKISLIYNGVDTNRFRPAPRPENLLPEGFAAKDALIIGTIGRLEKVKDQILLVKSFFKLLECRPELRYRMRLIIVGNGSCMEEIVSLINENDGNKLCWMAGYRDNSIDFYHAFDIFVLPSKREGISNTILEAMASGLPVVATDVGGNPEIIENNVCGQLVPPESPDAMAEAILNYIDNAELLKRHGSEARKHAESHYSLTAMVNNYNRVYESI